ncbi:four-carbon acid sugar kinase family protein [Aquiflexum sp.]|uniref:four-carbon acid sugar kinase family protein n=1 Tax=Aquiflexum sp. TaxID=1872584 RepID=UPI0035947701
MKDKKDILLSFYGDDFTGSSDVMESLSLMGIPTILFIDPPTLAAIENFNWKGEKTEEKGPIAFGVAGIARSLTPKEMTDELDPIFGAISEIPTNYFHYKICSTLDSAPDIGNIGTALDVAEKYFPSSFIPLLLGLPLLNRFVAFGNLFARIGDETFRLDRHPVMSRHPVTPMMESDIRRHLAYQMTRKISLVDFFALDNIAEKSAQGIIGNKDNSNPAPVILFDTLEDKHLPKIGQWIHKNSQSKHQLLLGSSAIEYALGTVYGMPQTQKNLPHAVSPTLIVAGSCSQTTADQLNHVSELGYEMVRLLVDQVFDDEGQAEQIRKTVTICLNHLLLGRNTVVFSALGPSDPAVQNILNADQTKAQPHRIAATQAIITKKIIEEFPLKRLVTAGGDTSGYIIKELGITALEFKNELAPGAPLCIAHAEHKGTDGLDIAIKGGQNGTVRYFEFAQMGGSLQKV